ncbi:hypothetical protein Celaphus_00008792 [Cervus elaphus hippelaphus]|uniref:Uncharacterized protein n=1 Tax=Cervus elaphus hippelaphus TaxID=46360 RepID=A0A212CP78_CEREH|nr:hypothetical protein Celaphus_00008792 [Cervus elaphus hippelaphus]
MLMGELAPGLEARCIPKTMPRGSAESSKEGTRAWEKGRGHPRLKTEGARKLTRNYTVADGIAGADN